MRSILLPVNLLMSCFISYAQVNVAIKKPVTVDSEISSQPAWKAVDGFNYSNANRWVSENNGYPHWIEIDLQNEYRLTGINFYTGYYGDNHPVHEYKLQSWTGSTWIDIIHVINNLSPAARHQFDPVTTSKVRLYALSGEGNALMLYEIEIFARFNTPPTIGMVTDPVPVYADEGIQRIVLEDISDGDTSSIQEISIAAASSAVEIVPDPVINYSQGDSTAELLWTPAGPEGAAIITVTISDDGGNLFGGYDSKEIQFTVSVRNPDKNYAPVIDRIPDVYAFSTGETYQINLTGISDGDPNKEQAITLSPISGNIELIENPEVFYTQGYSTGALKFSTKQSSGTAVITIKVKDSGGTTNLGTDSATISFNVVITGIDQAVRITTDLQQQRQVIEGFGGYGFERVDWSRGPYYSEEFIDNILNDLGVTILRISISPTGFEPFNDNADPYDTDLELFRHNIYTYDDWKYIDYIRDIHNADENIKVIASVWSPPAWMKSNNNVLEGGNLLPAYYEEYAEFITAYIRLFKQETGADLYAVSLQNEPTFWEPYQSCQYTPRTYCDLIRVVGERLEIEGLITKLFYPEEVMVRESDMAGWMNTLNNDEYARKYADIVAVHGYESTGISAGQIGGKLWEKYYNDYVNFPGYPKQFWMTETSGEQNSHEGAIRTVSGLSNAITHGRLNAWVYWTISEDVADPTDPDNVYDLMQNGVKLKKYYASKNYYRYVRPGARAVECHSTDIDVLVNAFWHSENNTLTYVLINKSGIKKIVNFDSYDMTTDAHLYRTSALENCEEIPVPSGSESFSLPPMSVSTFLLSGGEYNNHPPLIENVRDTVLTGEPDSLTVVLHGISDGDPDKDQVLELSTVFSNYRLIREIKLAGYSGTDSALLILHFNKAISGENITTIVLTEKDPANINQFMTVTKMSFSTWVVNYINNPPYYNELDTAYIQLSKGKQAIKLTGVTDGNEEIEESLDIEFWAVHDRYFSFDSLVYEQGDSNIYIWVTPKRTGAAIVKVSITDDGETVLGDNYFEDSFFIRVLDTDVSDGDYQDSRIILYPNPADQGILISNVRANGRFSVFNLSGRFIESGIIRNNYLYLDTENYPAGIYYIRINTTGDGFSVYKMIIVH